MSYSETPKAFAVLEQRLQRDDGRATRAWDGIAVSAQALSELEIALLELIDFGIDHWASAASRDLARSLVSRGLLVGGGENGDEGLACFALTPLGVRSLAAARSGPKKRTPRKRRLS